MEVWINISHDALAGVRANPDCIRLASLKSDGEYQLIIADFKKRLRVYNGTTIKWETQLLDVPVSIEIFYASINDIPLMAVATSIYLFVFKDFKPFFKFTMPEAQTDPREVEAWERYRGSAMSIQELDEVLNSLKNTDAKLTTRSLTFLAYENKDLKEAYLMSVKDKPLVQANSITATAVLRKSIDLENAQSMLVIGTERCQVKILDPSISSILHDFTLPAVPAFIRCSGLLDQDYLIDIACRNNCIYTIRKGDVRGSPIEVENAPLGLVRQDRYLYVGACDKKIHCYVKSRKKFTIYLTSYITAIQAVVMSRTRNFKGVAVSLASGEFLVYRGNDLVSRFKLDEPIMSFAFGAFGREEGMLVLNMKSGNLTVKMLDQRVQLDNLARQTGPPPEQDKPLEIPKKTTLYLEQVEREKKSNEKIYRHMQRDLLSLKLRVMQHYIALSKINPASVSGARLQVQAYIEGLGPMFVLILEVASYESTLNNVSISLMYDPKLYKVHDKSLAFPILIAGLTYKKRINVQCVDESGASDFVRVLISSGGSFPLASVNVEFPACEQA